MDFKDIRYINIGDAILICGGNISRGEAIKKAFILNYEEGEIITQEYASMLYGRKRHNLAFTSLNINYKRNELFGKLEIGDASKLIRDDIHKVEYFSLPILRWSMDKANRCKQLYQL